MNKKLMLLALSGIALTGPANAGSEVKILYVYTASVSNYYGGDANTKAKIAEKYDLMRYAHVYSNTIVTFSRTAFKTGYTNTSRTSLQHLNALLGSSGNDLKDARDQRNSTSSDLVQLFVDFSDYATYTGQGNQPGWSSVVGKEVLGATKGAGNSYTPTHEVGHSLNASHGQGFCMSNGKRTVMASGGGACPKSSTIGYFSSSSFKYGSVALGDSTHNNTQRIINQAPTAAGYK